MLLNNLFRSRLSETIWKFRRRSTMPCLFISVRFQSTNQQPRRIEEGKKSFYQLPMFHRFFNQFLLDNGLIKNVPKHLTFEYGQTLNEFQEVHEIVAQSDRENPDEFISLAKTELISLTQKLLQLQDDILDHSCTDDRDVNECTFEVRAGVGGKEASLFAQELFSLYSKFVRFNCWDIRNDRDEFEQVEIDENVSLFTQTMEVTGIGCYHLLRYEAGVHRVQRVPKTEKHGRIHTSTVSVSVLPIRQNLVTVKDSDLKFEVKNSAGAGGQNVNRNLTCVRVTYIPTGLTVESQETRFQYLNKDIAIRKLKALLNQIEYDRREKEARTQKLAQIGIASRSDKIKTYNFPQNRITDHRLTGDSNLYNIESYMAGNECEKMKQVINRLDQIRRQELREQLRSQLERKFLETHKSFGIDDDHHKSK